MAVVLLPPSWTHNPLESLCASLEMVQPTPASTCWTAWTAAPAPDLQLTIYDALLLRHSIFSNCFGLVVHYAVPALPSSPSSDAPLPCVWLQGFLPPLHLSSSLSECPEVSILCVHTHLERWKTYWLLWHVMISKQEMRQILIPVFLVFTGEVIDQSSIEPLHEPICLWVHGRELYESSRPAEGGRLPPRGLTWSLVPDSSVFLPELLPVWPTPATLLQSG